MTMLNINYTKQTMEPTIPIFAKCPNVNISFQELGLLQLKTPCKMVFGDI